ncbi:G5 domain-containing protein [Flavimobilis sp. GY10621]|uniref:G5 domain-containing protein n=1 Tax=Flavimobilis rhizosphaerae TaxID=2775421 RepID=A0ABR9DM61_9MICO|nr:G5 domain-containing protein [Flavimobilis rhizosphaerae]MBD9698220.1 G5 domain-containing protein [Flavimobilis rhizosphaerae]
MTSRRTARAAVASAVVLVVAAATTLTLTVLAPTGTPWTGAPAIGATAAPTERPTPASRSTERAHALPVALVVDGVERAVVTSAQDVTALLVEQDVIVGDRAVSHDLDAPVVSGMRVEIVDVTWTHETLEVDVEPELEEIEDPTLAAGTTRVVSAGTAGRSVTTYLVASVDGVESSRSEVVSVVLREPVAGRVRVGTDDAPSASPTPSARPSAGPSAEPTSPVTSAPAPDDGAGPDDDTAAPEPTPTATPSPKPSTKPEPKPSTKPEPKPEPTTAPPGTDGTTPASAKAIAKRKVAARGWSSSEYRCLVTLWERESNWSYKAANPSSTARGIPQALMSVHFGADWRTSEAGTRYLTTPSVQIDWGLRYIAGRYDGPCGALAHSDKRGWY